MLIAVYSETKQGLKFRPSTWMDMLSCWGHLEGPHRGPHAYHSLVRSAFHVTRGKCLLIHFDLENDIPWLWEHLLEFMRSHDLQYNFVAQERLQRYLSS